MDENSNVQVELASDTLDLNALLGMTDEEINAVGELDTSAPADTNSNVLVDEVTDEPHITIATSKVTEILKISAMIAAAGENSFEGKVVAFKIEGDNVRFLLSDNKRNIEKTVELVNTENRFEGFIAFSTANLARIIKLCGNTFCIIEREVEIAEGQKTKKYVLKVAGGEIHLDNIKMTEEKFVKDLTDKTSKPFKKVNITNSVVRLFTFATTAIKTGKNIDFVGNTIQANPINSIAKITTDEKLPSFRLTLTDARILLMLSSTDSADTISINKDGKIFTGDSYKFKTESFQTTDCVFDTVAERMFNGEYATIDVKHLTKVTELSIGLDSSIGDLKLNYKDGRVDCELLTKRENSHIIIQGTTNDDLTALENAVVIPSTNLRGALSVFQVETTVNIRISTDGVSLESGNIRVAVLSKNAGR